MTTHIDGLFELCKQKPFKTDEINKYICTNKMSSEEITKAALKLCDYGSFSYSEYIYANNKEPQPHELPTYNWELLFDVLIENGLDASLVICDDGVNYENILQSLQYLDNGDLNAKILRNVLSKGGSANILINGIPFFEEVDSNFVMDIQMGLYPYKWQVDNAFRFWLVLIGFGGTIKGGKLPVNMLGDNKAPIFKDYEKFDYVVIVKENDFELQIIEKATSAIVATV